MRISAVATAAFLLFAPLTIAQQPPPPPPPPPAQPAPQPAPEPQAAPAAAQEAAPSCSDCHEEAKTFVLNPHAHVTGTVVKGAVSNDACTPCHGDGTEHALAGGDKTKITKPAGKKGADEACLMCHETMTNKISRHDGMHANTGAVNCLTCHSMHHSDSKSAHLVAKPQLTLCGTCHTQAMSFRSKPYAHRLGRGGMDCTSCHEPHGRKPVQARSMGMNTSLRVTEAGEAPCLNCHNDKRGPWVFPHGANAVGDCTACHEVHGSVNPKQLKRANVWQLCIECHSPITTNTLGSQPPSFHNLNTARYQNCTTCHTAIHGSNRDPQLFK